jgi:hypothetical protein
MSATAGSSRELGKSMNLNALIETSLGICCFWDNDYVTTP